MKLFLVDFCWCRDSPGPYARTLVEMRLGLSGAAGSWWSDGVIFFMITTRATSVMFATHRGVMFSNATTGLAENPVAPRPSGAAPARPLTPPLIGWIFPAQRRAERERLPVTLLSPANGL